MKNKIIDLETNKKMRLNLSDLFENEWKFTTEEPIEPKMSHLKLIKSEKGK
jgi:hypothetical protein